MREKQIPNKPKIKPEIAICFMNFFTKGITPRTTANMGGSIPKPKTKENKNPIMPNMNDAIAKPFICILLNILLSNMVHNVLEYVKFAVSKFGRASVSKLHILLLPECDSNEAKRKVAGHGQAYFIDPFLFHYLLF